MNKLFLSCVSKEFKAYRTLLTMDLQRARVEVRVQESFGVAGKTLLDALDDYIRECDAIIHLIGDGAGAFPELYAVDTLRKRYPDLAEKVPVLKDALSRTDPLISYTQWEAYLALYHGRDLRVYVPLDTAPRGPEFHASDDDRRSQAEHLNRISELGWQRGSFENPDRLSAYVLGDLRQILPPDRKDFAAAPSKLPKKHDSGVFEGRESVLADLDALWADVLADKAGRVQIVSLVAIGGAGKTTVASRWKDSLLAREGRSGIERYFDWSFYSQGTRREGDTASAQTAADSTVFIVAALKFFGDPAMADSAAPAWDKGARLAALVAEHRTLLILDGLEPLQHPPGPQSGELKDDAIRALFAGLQQDSRGLCVVTTRELVADLLSTGDTTPQWRLDHLSDVAGALVLKRHGVIGPDDELRLASAEVKGHALTITLMGRYLKLAFHPADIARRDCFDFAEVNPEVQNGHAFRVFAAYERWFESEKRYVELAILRLLGLFDRPATPDCIAALCEAPVMPGLTEPLVGLSEKDWNVALNRLRGLGLIELMEWTPVIVNGYDETTAREMMEARQEKRAYRLASPQPFVPPAMSLPFRLSVDAHPLLREYFDEQLRLRGGARTAHDRLYEYLCVSAPYWPADRDGFLYLYQALAHGCKAGRFDEVCQEVYYCRITRRDEFYSTGQLGLFGLDLAAVASFFIEPWRRLHIEAVEVRSSLLAIAAFDLRALNRLVEALDAIRASIDLVVQDRNWRPAAITSTNLSELELGLGDVSAAVTSATQAINFADRSGDGFQRLCTCSALANALHYAGRWEESRALFVRAEKMQTERQPEYPVLYSVRGFHYCDLLLSPMERAAWRHFVAMAARSSGTSDLAAVQERATQTLEWSVKSHVALLNIGLDHLTLSRVHLLKLLLQSAGPDESRSETEHAREELGSALMKLREASTAHHLYRALLPVAWLHAIAGEWDQARQRLDEALGIATRGGNAQKGWQGGMRLAIVDTLLYRARLFGKLKNENGRIYPRPPAEYPWRGRTARGDLEEAAALIEACGYHRRDEELADAMEAIA